MEVFFENSIIYKQIIQSNFSSIRNVLTLKLKSKGEINAVKKLFSND